jgi:hypothetical protein
MRGFPCIGINVLLESTLTPGQVWTMFRANN